MKINETARISKNAKVATLKHLVAAVGKKYTKGLLVSGPPGVGKSTIVAAALNEAKIQAAYAPHHASPMGFYRFCWEHKDGLIVADDSANNMRNLSVQAIVKAMTWPCPQSGKRNVSWQSRKSVLESEGLPPSFEFTGEIIFIFNGTGLPSNDHNRAIESRLHHFNFELTFDERKVVISEIADPKKFEVSEDQMRELLEFIEKHAKPGSPNFDLRLLSKLSGLMLSDSSNWEATASVLLEVDPRYHLLKSIIDIMSPEYSVSQQADIFRKWGEQRGITGCGRSTFFNLMKLWFKPVNDLSPDQSELRELIHKEQSKNPMGSLPPNGTSPANSGMKARRGRPLSQPATESKNPVVLAHTHAQKEMGTEVGK